MFSVYNDTVPVFVNESDLCVYTGYTFDIHHDLVVI